MAALRGTEIIAVPIEEASSQIKTVPESLSQVAEVFFN
jgi:hypothetical protein